MVLPALFLHLCVPPPLLSPLLDEGPPLAVCFVFRMLLQLAEQLMEAFDVTATLISATPAFAETETIDPHLWQRVRASVPPLWPSIFKEMRVSLLIELFYVEENALGFFSNWDLIFYILVVGIACSSVVRRSSCPLPFSRSMGQRFLAVSLQPWTRSLKQRRSVPLPLRQGHCHSKRSLVTFWRCVSSLYLQVAHGLHVPPYRHVCLFAGGHADGGRDVCRIRETATGSPGLVQKRQQGCSGPLHCGCS